MLFGCSRADTWKQATSQDHFEKLIHVDRKLGSYTFRQLCVRTLRLCKNLPYSPVNWLYLILLGVICALYGYVLLTPDFDALLARLGDHLPTY